MWETRRVFNTRRWGEKEQILEAIMIKIPVPAWIGGRPLLLSVRYAYCTVHACSHPV